MASAPKANLPLLYNDLMPLNSRDHADWSACRVDTAPWVAKQHAIPVTTDEFVLAQRFYPIVFSNGEHPVPLVLMGLNEGVNTFFDDDGKAVDEEFYVPAYIRRYPFLLARLEKDSDRMSLCFDPSSGLVGEFKDGHKLFDGDQPTQETQEVMRFCESFEQAGQRTANFVDELKKADLLMDGEVAIQRGDNPDLQPFVYRGFQMVNQEKLREIRGDQLRSWNQSGLLPLIFAHLFSLDRMRGIFARQVQQGKGPKEIQAVANIPAAAEQSAPKPEKGAKKAETAKS